MMIKQKTAFYVSAFVLNSLLIASVAVSGKPAQDKGKIDPQSADFFEAKIRPLLLEKCVPCHGPKSQSAGLRLDSWEAIAKGNSGGPAVVPTHPEKSSLIQVIGYEGQVKMPPSGKLKTEEILALTEWVKTGAAWPGTPNSGKSSKSSSEATAKKPDSETKAFWSFRPVTNPFVPSVARKQWCANPIDNFILAKIESKKLTPAPFADRRSLIRRVTFDLIGLPPTSREVDDFLSDQSPNAYDKVVDRLLASSHYGERWARLWMDVARYADTKGYVFVEDRNYYNAYTYRDYLIQSFNDNKPYDRFVTEQLAADKLELGEDKRPLAAMGFLTLGRRFLNNPPDIIDDRIDVVCRGLLGLTTNCARCHDHKFDPISTKDYYALYGIFDSSVEYTPAISPRQISEPYDQYRAKLEATKGERTSKVRAQVQRLRSIVQSTPDSLPADVKKILQAVRPEVEPDENQLNVLYKSFEPTAVPEIQNLRKRISEMENNKPQQPDLAMAMKDSPNPHNVHVFIRGNPGNRGPDAPRKFLTVLSSPDAKPYSNGSGRLELAQSITSKENPLTARVFVNRIWRHHFGNGIVRTPSDFGFRGDAPTHPELLDWLAYKFMDTGWNIKAMQKLIVTSSTYKLSSTPNPGLNNVDPENRLLSHANRRRLDLEQTRDSVLTASGSIDFNVGGKSVELTTEPHTTRRSVYGFIERQNLPGFFRTFDLASPDTTSPQRFSTTVPQQALFMMNSPFVVKEAQVLARRPEFASNLSIEDKITVAYQLVFARIPTSSELSNAKKYLQEDLGTAKSSETQTSGGDTLTRWERYIQALLMTNEFVFVD